MENQWYKNRQQVHTLGNKNWKTCVKGFFGKNAQKTGFLLLICYQKLMIFGPTTLAFSGYLYSFLMILNDTAVQGELAEFSNL